MYIVYYTFLNLSDNFLYEQISFATEDKQSLQPFSTRSRRSIDHHMEKCSFHSKINCCGDAEVELPEDHQAVKEKCFAEHFPKEERKHDPFSCENIKAMKNKVSVSVL